MVTYYLIVLICNIACWCHADNSTIDHREEFCEEVKKEEITAFVGFPFQLGYSREITKKLYRRSLEIREEANVTCTVTEETSSQVITTSTFPKVQSRSDTPLNDLVSYQTNEVTMDTIRHLKTKCKFSENSLGRQNKSGCFFYSSIITILNQLSDNCNGSSLATYDREMEQGNRKRLLCKVPKYLKKYPNVSYHWFREKEYGECTDKFQHNVWMDNSNNLNFNNVDFDDAGVYTCMAYNNDHKIILRREKVCVKHHYIINRNFKLKCEAKKVSLNENVTITCNMKVSTSKDYWGYYYWYKISGDEETLMCNGSYVMDEKRITCLEVTSLEKDGCYFTKPSGDPPIDFRTLTLHINNMKNEDFGEYRVVYYVIGRSNEAISNITIEMDMRQQGTITRITIAVFAIILVIILFILGLAMKMDLLWFYKRYFRPMERDITPYMAYFVYNYRVKNKGAERKDKINILVTSMHNLVDRYGGTVFDGQRDGPLEQCEGDNILAAQNNCHRIVLFLSPDFITDHWSRFAIYTAIESVIKEGKKIIFITMPGTKDTMKQIEEAPRRVLEMAIKRNTAIYWNGKFPLSGKFRRRLEYALPKYHKPHLRSLFCDLSEARSTQHEGSAAKSLIEMRPRKAEIGASAL